MFVILEINLIEYEEQHTTGEIRRLPVEILV